MLNKLFMSKKRFDCYAKNTAAARKSDVRSFQHNTSLAFKLPVLIGLVLFISCFSAMAQKSRQQLEKEKRENMERLQELQGILKQTTEQKRSSLGQLKAIKQQINAQNRKIDLINDDLKLMDSELTELQQAKVALDKDLDKLRDEYARMIYNASKRNNSLSELSFLFSAPTFNQFLVRYKYLKQYTDEREKQVTQMKKVQSLMIAKSNSISNKKKDQENALKTRIAESKNLEQLKGEKDKVVQELSGREAEIKGEVAEVRKANKQLENALTRIIQREIEERRERARAAAREKAARERAEREAAAKAAAERAKEKDNNEEITKAEPPAAKPEPKKEELNNEGMNEEEVTLAASFAANRGRLPWPVPGFISDGFGTKEVIKNVYQENQGVDIQTTANAAVRAVYDGIVMDVSNEPTVMKNFIFVQHGDFYTVYAKLKSVNVRVGQRIKAREPIGVVATNGDGVSEVNFQIWKENKNTASKLNPEVWLRPR
ncbi:peptidase M23 [Runella aurantiaca]|uniref:Peptidase M23 n=2 Tax=Runella aurantiaca TaxID=2282308 RepID=A0A369ID49_9BACT|nr:peptidase M23 [Runella aurantiaca]